MRVQEGVDLHFIETDKFTTNRITIRFAAPMRKETVAGRILIANIIEMGNQDFPSAQDLKRHLASLYGASLSTSVAKKGKVHFVEISLSYIQPAYLPEQLDLTQQMLDLLFATLFKPLKERGGFVSSIFETEQRNLMAYLEAEVEDNFYHAAVETSKLFFTDEDMQISKVAQLELVEQETATTAYKALQQMLRLDKVDIFVLGKVNQEEVFHAVKAFGFTYRNPILELEYSQPYSPVIREKVERKESKQSVLELAYSLQVVYGDVNYLPLVVFNGLLGAFSHSKLFAKVREQEGLAYTIGSHVSIFSGLLKVYAGIDRRDRLQVIKLINRQLLDIKQGKFTDQELELTKELLTHSATLAQDRPSTLIEQVSNSLYLEERNLEWEDWIVAVNQVSREDIVRVGKCVQLQAVYFMEGIES